MIGVVADDTTGANDIGIMFRKNGYLVKVVGFEPGMIVQPDADVWIIDTDSRLDQPEASYSRVFAATKALQAAGCSLYHNKTCSVFRGNIGAEFDAMLDALGEDFAVISLAFPKNGRQTCHGMHSVHGKPLEESEFRRDPVHPMLQSNLVAILQSQTNRRVCGIDIEIVRQGPDALRQAINAAGKAYNYCIIDTIDQADLNCVAAAVQGLPVLAGSSAIAEELPKFWPSKPFADPLTGSDLRDTTGVLVVSGSLMPQTQSQTQYLREQGIKHFVLDTRTIFAPNQIETITQALVATASSCLAAGEDVLVMADDDPQIVADTKELGRVSGLDPLAASKAVSQKLAEITEKLVTRTQLKRLVIAGGDTSGTICRRLGIKGNYVLDEIETGIPSGLAIGRNMLVVLKSGSFGKADFLSKAVDHLKRLGNSEPRAD